MNNLKSSVFIAFFTFLIAILVTLSSQTRIEYVSLLSAIIILIIIIFIGIISDMIGVAATVARKKSLNARAAKKIFGARQSLYLAQHGDRVASFMCDIVGDICGTVSGAIGAVIVIRIVNNWGGSSTLINLIIIGIISAITVGGKAYLKSYGMKKADEIIFFVGKILGSLGLIKQIMGSKLRGGE